MDSLDSSSNHPSVPACWTRVRLDIRLSCARNAGANVGGACCDLSTAVFRPIAAALDIFEWGGHCRRPSGNFFTLGVHTV